MSHFQFAVIGAGPAGQKAAIQAAKAGVSVVMIERGRRVGGDCVHRGTIPSKALRETALQLSNARHTVAEVHLPDHTPLHALLNRVDQIIDDHVQVYTDQLERNGVTLLKGHGQFTGPHTMMVQPVRGDPFEITADHFVIATGSKPRKPAEIPVDHEYIVDSDSVLSLPWLPRSLLVLGGGVIACEYATTFKELGVRVTIVDSAPRPLGFMDADLTDCLLQRFNTDGCKHISNDSVASIEAIPGTGVRTILKSGMCLETDKVLVALGRVANVDKLGVELLGLELSARRQLAVDEHFRTEIPHIYAVGDVIGFPALAATSMEQGRQAARHALGLETARPLHGYPIGIYTIPAMASVGLTEVEALSEFGAVRVGRCRFDEVARGKITGHRGGLLKLISDVDGTRILGVHIVGEDATELVHIGQMAMLGGLSPSTFVDNVFNFPTHAEAYRIAAFDLMSQGAVILKAA